VYVIHTSAILGVAEKEAAFVSFVRENRFTAVTLYDAGPALREPAASRLAGLVARLRRDGRVQSVGAPIASVERLAEVVAYGDAHPQGAFDAVVTELEYWNDCDGARGERACFGPFVSLLEAMRAAARPRGIRVGAYLGYPTKEEALRIASLTDYVLLNYPVRDPRTAYEDVHPRGGALSARMQWFATTKAVVWPILYTRGEVHMGDWVRAHGLLAAEEAFLAGAVPEVRPRIGGFQFFAHDVLDPPQATILHLR